MSQETQLLELDGLIKDFPGVRALDGVSLTLAPGQVHAVCGENGAGKSTLLKILAGCHPFGSYEGDVRIDGKTRRFFDPGQAEEAGVALVAQELALVEELSIAENMFLGSERRKGLLVDWADTRAQAKEALARVGLDEDVTKPVGELSVGKQQLVEIARALHKRAKVLVLDEPTAALPEADVARLLELVKSIAAQGVGCMYVSHRLEEVTQISDWITVIRDGKSVGDGPIDQWNRDKIVAAMVGRELAEEEHLRAGKLDSGAPFALRVRGLDLVHPDYAHRQALRDVSLELRSGEVLGVAGLMGAGRTALLSTLFGAARSTVQGEVQIQDEGWRPLFGHPREAIAQGLCLVSEDRKGQGLVASGSVKENLALATLQRFVRSGLIDWNQVETAAAGQRDSLRIKVPHLETPVDGLSGGNQQKVVLGRWLIAGPKVLLLDEPTRGIDVGAKAEIYRLIRELAAKGLAVLVASSDLPELLSLCHRILVMANGRVAAELDEKDFSQEAVMHAATQSN